MWIAQSPLNRFVSWLVVEEFLGELGGFEVAY